MTARDIKIWLIFLLTFIAAGLLLGLLIVFIQKISGLGKIHPIILGVFGGLFGMGIINQPNVGILAVGSIQKRAVVKETEFGDTIVIRHMVYLTLSYDHRIIDGATMVRFNNLWMSYLTQPEKMLMHLK